jgi:hypothetical protein
MFHFGYENDDPFNIAKERNTRNTDRGEYNCGGYALGCYSWYCPFSHQVRDFEKNVKQILKDFPNARLIDNTQDLMPNEYMVAFRLSRDDFHFMKRGKNGVWREKRGSQSEIRIVPKSVVFGEVWSPDRYDNGYQGEIAFFAVKVE